MIRIFWSRFCKIGLYTLLAYLAIGYVVLFSSIFRWEVQLWNKATPVTAVVSGDELRTGYVNAHVRNVFGDPIPHAVVFINNRLVQADSTGYFEISNLPPGNHRLEVFAGGYQRYEWEIKVETGVNSPIIKYDSGLWPEGFLADFHVFYNDETKIFGIVGFANGLEEPIYLHRAIITNSHGDQVLDLFEENDGFTYYQNLSTRLDVVESPQQALALPAQSWVSGDLPPITGPFQAGMYDLVVYYGVKGEHETNEYRKMVISDYLELDNNWNPHLP